MGNVTFKLPDGNTIVVDESTLDAKGIEKIRDAYDLASGEAGVGTKLVNWGKAAVGGVLQNISEVPKFIAQEAKRLDEGMFGGSSYGDKSAKDLATYKFGDYISNLAPHVDARVRDQFGTQVSQGLGQVAGMIGTAVVTKGAGASAVSAVSMQGAEDYSRAKDKGATEQQALEAGAWGGVWGLTDLIPMEKGLKILEHTTPGIRQTLLEMGKQGLTEGVQEGFQQVLSNATAKLTYDQQQALMEDVLPSATVGGAVGFIAGGVLHALGAKGKIKIPDTKATSTIEKPDADSTSVTSTLERLNSDQVVDEQKPVEPVVTVDGTPVSPVGSESVTLDTMAANADQVETPSQTFGRKLIENGATPGEAHVTMSIWNAFAGYRGEDLDTFVQRNVADVQGETLGSNNERSALNQTGQGAEPFFSKLEQVVKEKVGGKVSGEQLIATLEKNGVSKDELNNFLNEAGFGPKDVVSKQTIQEAIEASKVKLEDVVLGEKDPNLKGMDAFRQEYANPNGVQFASYTLPGAKEGSYREMFVTAPSEGTITRKAGDVQYLSELTTDDFTPEGEESDGTVTQSRWQDGHFQYSSIQNPVVRVRFNERTVDNKRVLFVEEMQGPSDSEQSKMPDYLRKRIYDIGTKRILSYAKQNGFDGVAWTTGEQQAERYDLSKQVSKVEWIDLGTRESGNHEYSIMATGIHGEALNERVSADKLEATVGKDLATKIIESKDGKGSFKGLDLKVGGEGLKRLYDKMLPSLMKKYGKGSVETIEGVPYTNLDKSPTSFPLFQNIKGSVEFLDDARAIITLMKGSDISTILHESAHIFRRNMLDEDSAIANEWVGATSNDWTVEQEEKFARGFERYLRRGKAPNEYLAGVFEKIRTWLRRIYKVVKGSEINVNLDPKITALFDKILTPRELPSQKKAWQMPYEAWKVVHGEDLAAIHGVTEKSVSVRQPSRFNKLVSALKKPVDRAIIFGRFMTPAEVKSQATMVEDPAYLQTPIANRDIDTYITRVLNKYAVEANAAYHDGQDLEPILKDLKQQMRNADEKGLFDSDRGTAIDNGELGTELVTRRMQFEDTIGFVQKLNEVVRIRKSWDVPIRAQLGEIKQTQFKGKQDVVMDRKTGEVFAIESVGLQSAALTNVDKGTVRRVSTADLHSQFIWPDMVNLDKNATLTKDEWLLEQHYKEVSEAVARGEEVPPYAIEPHLVKDPSLQEAYDEAVRVADLLDHSTEQRDYVRYLYQSLPNATVEEEQPKIVVGPATQIEQKDLQVLGDMTGHVEKALNRLSNVLDKEDGRALLDMISKVDIQKLANVTGKVGQNTVEGYFEQMYEELDSFKQILKDHSDKVNSYNAAKMFDRLDEMFTQMNSWITQIVDNGDARLLEPGETVSYMRNFSHWFQENILQKEPTTESAVGWAMFKGFFTMQGASNRKPVLKPLWHLGIGRMNKATGMANAVRFGKDEIEYITQQNKDGSETKIALRLPGLRAFESFNTNSPEYNNLRGLIIAGDKIGVQFSRQEIVGGMDAKITELLDAASKAKGDEAAVLTQQATVYAAMDKLLGNMTTEQRGQVAKAYWEVQDTLKYMYYKTKQYLTEIVGTRSDDMMQKIFPSGYVAGYFPHMRFGKYGALVKDKEGKTVYFTAFEDHVSQKNALEELRAKYPDHDVAAVDTTNKIEYKIGGGQDLITALNEMIGSVKLDEVLGDVGQVNAVQKMLFDSASEMVKTHGIFSAFKERLGIPGYDERIKQVMDKRVRDFSSALAKMDFAVQGAQELSKLRAQPQLYNYASEWFQAQLEGADKMDALVDKIGAAIYLKQLGFNVKTALVVFMDKFINAPSVLGKFTDHADAKILRSLELTARNFKPWFSKLQKVIDAEGISRAKAIEKLGLPKGFDAETTQAMLWSLDNGATLAKFTQEIMNHESLTWESGRSGLSQFGKMMANAKFVTAKVFDASSWMISHMEELNKLSTFHAAFTEFRKKQNYTFDRALDVSQNVVNDAHMVYGRSNIPLPFMRKGIWKAARLAYKFRSFEHNYVQWLFNSLTVEGPRGKMMALRSLAALVALAGVPALPFFAAIFKAWGISTGTDPEQWFRKTLNQYDSSHTLAKLFSDGLPAIADVSIRGSLQVGAYTTLPEIGLGVVGSTYNDIVKAATSAKGGDWDTFAKTVLPTAVVNPYKAQQGSTTGVMTGKGTPLREDTIGKQLKYDGYEALAKSLGFTITRELDAQRIQRASDMEDQYWGTKRQAIYTKIAKGARMGDKAYIQSAIEDITAYERERVNDKAFDVAPISRSALRQSLQESGLRKQQVLQVMRLTGAQLK